MLEAEQSMFEMSADTELSWVRSRLQELVEELEPQPGIWNLNDWREVYDRVAQLNVLLRAMEVYDDRSMRYGDAWRAQGWRGVCSEVLRKAQRVRSMFWSAPIGHGTILSFKTTTPHEHPNDLVDLINYAALMIRGSAEGIEWGK